jgi:hypothetical protein
MKLILLTFVLLSFPSLALGQCPSEKKYDRFADKTIEMCSGLYVANDIEPNASSTDTFTVSVHVEYSSEQRHKPLAVTLNINEIQLVRRGIARPRLDGQKVLYLLTDNKRGELPIGKYTPVSAQGALAEIIQVPLNTTSLEALLTARRVEARIAGREFQFTDDGLANLQKYLSELKPLGHRTVHRDESNVLANERRITNRWTRAAGAARMMNAE